MGERIVVTLPPGPQGDKGATGAQGVQGIPGPAGPKGDKGDPAAVHGVTMEIKLLAFGPPSKQITLTYTNGILTNVT